MSRRISGAILSLICAVLMTEGDVSASTDGTLGTTSTGDDSMTLDIPNLVKISGIGDLSFGNYSGSGSAVQADDVCVYTNGAAGEYKVTIYGSGASSAFTLTNGIVTIPYTVKWNNAAGAAGSGVTANVQSGVLNNANTAALDCGGTMNANFQVTMTQSALLNVPAGTYTGVLTIVIDPN